MNGCPSERPGATLVTPRCVAGIVFAVPIEADALERKVGGRVETEAGGLVVHEGRLGGRRVVWCVAGVGRERAGRAARLLVAGHRPAALVSAGFAGGLVPGLARGAAVRPTAVRSAAADAPILPLAGAAAGGPVLVTVDRIVRTPSEKAAVAAATGAGLVDMETLAVAEVARETGLPCHAIRVVSDAAADSLPADVVRLVAPQSTPRRLGSVLGMLGRRPRAAIDLWRLWEHAVADGRTLAAALEEILAALPAPAAT